MTAEVLPFQPATTDPLAALYAERDAVQAELARFQKVDDARVSAERELARLDEEQAAIDEAERADWSAWAPTCEGPTPSPRTEAREALARKRVAAAASLASAVNGAKAVEPRPLALNAEFRRISDEIFEARVAQLVDRGQSSACRGVRGGEGLPVRRPADRRYSRRALRLPNRGNELGNEARAAVTTAAIDQIEAMVRPDLIGDINERARIAADVKRELDQ